MLGFEPAGEAVGSEMLLDDEVGRAGGGEPVKPGQQQGVQLGLADSDGRVRPEPVDHQAVGHVVGSDHDHVREVVCGCVFPTQVSCPFVDLDCIHGGVGIAGRKDAGDRPVAGAEIDQDRIARRWLRPLEQEQLGPGIDAISGEHTTIGDQRKRAVGEGQLDGLASRSSLGRCIEIVLTHAEDATSASEWSERR